MRTYHVSSMHLHTLVRSTLLVHVHIHPHSNMLMCISHTAFLLYDYITHVRTHSASFSPACAQKPVPTNMPSFCLCAHPCKYTHVHKHTTPFPLCAHTEPASHPHLCAHYLQVHTVVEKSQNQSSEEPSNAITRRGLRFTTRSPSRASALKSWVPSYVATFLIY